MLYSIIDPIFDKRTKARDVANAVTCAKIYRILNLHESNLSKDQKHILPLLRGGTTLLDLKKTSHSEGNNCVELKRYG